MNKLINKSAWLLVTVFTLLCFSQCKDDDTYAGSGYGYVQFKLMKKGSSTITKASETLGSLADAKKIKISLIDVNNMEIEQSLNVNYFSESNAEYGVRTEPIKLAIGNYTVKSYEIFNVKNESIQKGDVDDDGLFEVIEGHNAVVKVSLDVRLKGKLSLVLGKDDSQIRPSSRSTIESSSNFEYSDIRSVFVSMKEKNTGIETKRLFKVINEKVSGRDLFYTDTLDIPVGDYIVTHYDATTAKDGIGTYILAESASSGESLKDIVISDAMFQRDTLTMTLPKTDAIKDYLVLYKIWKDMKGESWKYQGTDANWVFDGRTVDTWGNQLGIGLDENGRVKSLNIGVFNAQGDIPEEIGNLTQLEILYLGTHSEEGWLDAFDLSQKGIDYTSHRMDIAKERSNYRHEKEKSMELDRRGYVASKLDIDNKKHTYKYISTYDVTIGTRTNSIKSIPETIGKLKNLEQLYIASGLITELPAALGQMSGLTDLEIYNCPITRFPTQIKDLSLVSLNFSSNGKINPDVVKDGLETLCDGEVAKTLQLLYVNEQKLTELPANMYKLQKLGLLDVSRNKLVHLPSMIHSATEKVNPVQVFLDNNQLIDIPDDFCGTNDLEKFTASNNKLEYFPNLFTAISYYTLEEIDFSINQIRGFKSGFMGFRAATLDLSMNRFDLAPSNGIMPEEFGKLYDGTIGKDDKIGKHANSVTSLKLNQCGIDSICPKAIENLNEITGFGLVGNNLRYLPSNFGAATMPYLNGIDVSFNSFRSIPVRILNIPGMVQIIIEHQYDHNNGKRVLKTFETNIFKHPALKTLYLTGNDIISISTFPINLNVLAVSDNPNLIMDIPSDICSRIANGTFMLGFDDTQSGITGCPILGIK